MTSPTAKTASTDGTLESLIDRFCRAVCAYHAESHRDFEDAQSRALEMDEARVALSDYVSAKATAAYGNGYLDASRWSAR